MSMTLNSLATHRTRYVFGALLAFTYLASSAPGAVATRHYDFEEGEAGTTTDSVEDITTDLFITSDATGIWESGHVWVEVAGWVNPRPLPPGPVADVIDEWALAAPMLEAAEGEATFVDVSDGTAFDSPALGSNLALQFDGTGFFDDINLGDGEDTLGSRGVYVERTAYDNNDEGDGDNRAESFNLITQGWVYPSSEGMGESQTVWVSGTEQGSVNITEDGFWEFGDFGSVGILNPGVEVAFDSWTHFGLRRGGNGAEVYINGELVDGDINPAESPNFFNTFAGRITLGGNSEGENGFVGLVDDFKVMGTADLLFDPNVDWDFFAGNEVGCTPLNSLLGDLDGMDGVAFADFLILSGNFGQEVGSYEEGDIDCSGTVDFADFLSLSGNFGETLGRASAVPEPSGFALLLPGLLALVCRKRR